jgi:hypothetical protein
VKPWGDYSCGIEAESAWQAEREAQREQLRVYGPMMQRLENRATPPAEAKPKKRKKAGK